MFQVHLSHLSVHPVAAHVWSWSEGTVGSSQPTTVRLSKVDTCPGWATEALDRFGCYLFF